MDNRKYEDENSVNNTKNVPPNDTYVYIRHCYMHFVFCFVFVMEIYRERKRGNPDLKHTPTTHKFLVRLILLNDSTNNSNWEVELHGVDESEDNGKDWFFPNNNNNKIIAEQNDGFCAIIFNYT